MRSYQKKTKSLLSIFDKSLVMGPKESLRIILKKIGVFIMWATCLKKLMKQVTLKGEKDQGDLKVAGLKITSCSQRANSSQENKPGTHAMPNKISKMMDIPRTLSRRIIAEDLKLQSFKKSKGQ